MKEQKRRWERLVELLDVKMSTGLDNVLDRVDREWRAIETAMGRAVTDGQVADYAEAAKRNGIRTEREIQALKLQWADDGSWELESTEGFEAHREELLAFRLEREEANNRYREAHLASLAELWGMPGNFKAAARIDALLERLEIAETMIDALMEHVPAARYSPSARGARARRGAAGT